MFRLQFEFTVLAAFILTVDFFVVLLNVSCFLVHYCLLLTFSNFVLNDNPGLLSHVCVVAVPGIQSRSWDEKGFVYKRE